MGHCRPQNSVNIKYGKWTVIGITKWNAGNRAMSGSEGRFKTVAGKDDSHLRRRDQLIDPKQDYCQQRSCAATNLE